MNQSLKRQLLKTFSQMIDDLNGTKEIEEFLSDFFDEKELEKYIKRISIVYWLKKGRTKENIKDNLKVNPTEIAATEKFLKRKGVRLALKKIEAEEWANKWNEKFKRISSKIRP